MDVVKDYVQLLLEKGPQIFETVAPIAEQLFEHGKVLFALASMYANYVELMLGVLFLFWGGNFVLLVAAMEAFKVVGYKRLKENLHDLYKSYLIAREAYSKDVTKETEILEFASRQMHSSKPPKSPHEVTLRHRPIDPRSQSARQEESVRGGRDGGRGGGGASDWEGRKKAAEAGTSYSRPLTPNASPDHHHDHHRPDHHRHGIVDSGKASASSGGASGASAHAAGVGSPPSSVQVSSTSETRIEEEKSVEAFGGDETRSTAEEVVEGRKEDMSGEVADAKEDANGGEPTKDQLSAVARLANVARAVDPDLVSKSFGSLCAGVVAVIATLQSNMARVLALGASMGDLVMRPFQATAREILVNVLPLEYHKWINVTLSYFTRLLGILVAFFFQRWILITNLCMQSSKWIISAAIKFKIFPKSVEDKLQLLSVPIALLGIAKQVLYGYELPFILWLVLIPALLLEWICTFFVISTVAPIPFI